MTAEDALAQIQRILQTAAHSGKKPTVAELNEILRIIDRAMAARTPEPAVENFGLLPIVDAQAYLDGWHGKNDLKVGPNMLAWALESALRYLAVQDGGLT